MKDEFVQFLEERKLKDLIKKHSEFIFFPIELRIEKTTNEKEVVDEEDDEKREEDEKNEEKKEGNEEKEERKKGKEKKEEEGPKVEDTKEETKEKKKIKSRKLLMNLKDSIILN